MLGLGRISYLADIHNMKKKKKKKKGGGEGEGGGGGEGVGGRGGFESLRSLCWVQS